MNVSQIFHKIHEIVIPLHFISLKKLVFFIFAGAEFYQVHMIRAIKHTIFAQIHFFHEIKRDGLTIFVNFMFYLSRVGSLWVSMVYKT